MYCGAYGVEERCVEGIGGESGGKETILETLGTVKL
jgi:hypothetical protein